MPPSDRTPREPVNRQRVSLTDEWELLWWSKHFAVDADTLRAAVDEVGEEAEAVRSHLDARPQP